MPTIRPACSEDAATIRALIVPVFFETYGSGEVEADLVEALRGSDAYLPELELVAVELDEIVGHALFSIVQIELPEGPLPALVLAPLGVARPYRRQGVGAALMERGLAVARELGYGCVFVEGNPRYYGRFGFQAAGAYGLTSPFVSMDNPHHMVLALSEGALEGVSGLVSYPPAWAPLMP